MNDAARRLALELDVIEAIVALAEHMGYPDGFVLPVPQTDTFVSWGSAASVIALLEPHMSVLVDAPDLPANDPRA